MYYCALVLGEGGQAALEVGDAVMGVHDRVAVETVGVDVETDH